MKRIFCSFLAALALLSSSGSAQATVKHHHRTHHHAARRVVADNSVRVWVNTKTGVYHYQGERWYGNTEEGQYMTENQAIKAGYRATENGQ